MISEKKLIKVISEILKGYGENKESALLAADCLVKADMRGISTHGTYLLIPMFQRVKAGMLDLPTKITLVKENNATSIIDGGNGLGQFAAKKAMDISIKKAKKYGIALTLVRNTNNISFLGYYSNLATQEGLIGFIGFIWIFVGFTKAYCRSLRSNDSDRQILAFGGIACIIVLFLAGITSSTFFIDPWQSLMLWIPFGITATAAGLKDEVVNSI